MTLKQDTHEVSVYWSTIRLAKGTALYHKHPTHEVDFPYRWGISHIFRVPFTTLGFMFGKWNMAQRTEEQAVLAGLAGREVAGEDLETVKDRARKAVAENAIDLDDEWKIVDILGLH